MSQATDCIFCQIVAGEIPSFQVYQDAATLAFMDINPFNPGHCLVIPKAHAADIFAIAPDDIAAVARTAKIVAGAVRAALRPAGINIVQANGPAAGQTVHHFHCHVFPRAEGDGAAMNWGMTPGDMAEIETLASRIRDRIEP